MHRDTGGAGGAGPRRGEPRGSRRLSTGPRRPGGRGRLGDRPGAGDGGGVGQRHRVGGPFGTRGSTARPAPYDAAVPVRLTRLGPKADTTGLRFRPPTGGVRPEGQARARLLHDAAAGGRPAGRAGGPGPRGAYPPSAQGRRPLTARKGSFEPFAVTTAAKAERAVAHLADALREAAEWVGCDAVRVDRLDPPALAAPLGAALS